MMLNRTVKAARSVGVAGGRFISRSLSFAFSICTDAPVAGPLEANYNLINFAFRPQRVTLLSSLFLQIIQLLHGRLLCINRIN